MLSRCVTCRLAGSTFGGDDAILRYEPDSRTYTFYEVTYEFAPVPEPATLLLLSVGGAVLGARKLRVEIARRRRA